MEIIALFLPACISVSIRHRRNKELSWNLLPTFIEYGILSMVNVWVSVGTVTLALRIPDVTAEAFRSFPFFSKYMVISVMAAFLVPYAEEIIRKCIGVTFSVKTAQKEDADEGISE